MVACGRLSHKLVFHNTVMDRNNPLPRTFKSLSPARDRFLSLRSSFAAFWGAACVLLLGVSASAQPYPNISGAYTMSETNIYNVTLGSQGYVATRIITNVTVRITQTNGQFTIIPNGSTSTNLRVGVLSGNSVTNMNDLPVPLLDGYIAFTNMVDGFSGTVYTNQVDIFITNDVIGIQAPQNPFQAKVFTLLRLTGPVTPLQPPVITTQPTNLTVTLGASASFTVVATGATPLTYQWRRDSAIIPGATNAAYTIASTTNTDVGSYVVYVYNSAGSTTSTPAILSANYPARIMTQPAANTTAIYGGLTTLSVKAGGTPPFQYQWRLMNTNLVGVTNASYTFVALPINGVSNLTYSVVVSNAYGSEISRDANVTIIDDHHSPAVTISSPKANSRLDQVSFGGLAVDNGIIASVTYWVTNINDGRVQVSVPKAATMIGTNLTRQFWTNFPDLLPGSNVVAVYSSDIQGNRSKVATRAFFYKSPTPLVLGASGLGGITGRSSVIGASELVPTLGSAGQLYIGQGYSVQATPAANWLFSGWTKSLGGVDRTITNQTLWFNMEPGLSLTATFVTNPFVARAGSYSGTFSADPIAPESSGLFRCTLDKKGAFTGQLIVNGRTYPIGGGFNLDGHFTKTIARPASAGGPLNLNLSIALGDAASSLTGVISSAGWNSVLEARPAALNLASSQHTVILPPGSNSPVGFGVLLITNKGPNATITGKLADGTQISAASTVWNNGILPIYSSLYKGTGVLLGQISPSDTNFANSLVWIKRSAVFTNTTTPLISSWVAPVAKTPAVPFTTNSPALVDITGGPLSVPLSFMIYVPSNNRIIRLPSSGSPDSLTGSVDPKTGAFKLSVKRSGKVTSGSGAVLHDRWVGYGIFGSGTNYGAIFLRSQDAVSGGQ